MSQLKSYSSIYKVQRIILLFFYTTTMLALSYPLALWINYLSPDNFFPLIVTFIVYTVFAVVLGTFIYLVSYIPFNLSSAFDPIKNDIASGKIRNVDDFGREITSFITRFFDFSFLDIEYAVFQNEENKLISNQENPELLKAIREFDLLQTSKTSKEITLLGKIKIDNKSYKLYVLPIWFGEKWLGCIGLVSANRINRFFLKFLMEFEDNFLDDQLMHLNRSSKAD